MEKNKASIPYIDYVKGIDRLNLEEQLSLLEIISSKVKKTLGEKRIMHSILELEGLGAEMWGGIDAQEYVRKERESWD